MRYSVQFILNDKIRRVFNLTYEEASKLYDLLKTGFVPCKLILGEQVISNFCALTHRVEVVYAKQI